MKNLQHALKTALYVLIGLVVLAGCGSTPRPARITVLTYNIYHGEDAQGGSNLDAVARVINRLKPDLVALQEVDNKTERAKGLDLTFELSRRTGMEGVFGQAMPYSGGGYGEAVLTRLPILGARNHPLPYVGEAEPRAALEITVPLANGESLRFVGTHLDHQEDPENRLMQARRLVELYADSTGPVILAGDLNATPQSEPMALLLAQWACACQARAESTFPAAEPTRKIDYILYRPQDRWRIIETRVIDETVASDHRPVWAVLELLAEH